MDGGANFVIFEKIEAIPISKNEKDPRPRAYFRSRSLANLSQIAFLTELLGFFFSFLFVNSLALFARLFTHSAASSSSSSSGARSKARHTESRPGANCLPAAPDVVLEAARARIGAFDGTKARKEYTRFRPSSGARDATSYPGSRDG